MAHGACALGPAMPSCSAPPLARSPVAAARVMSLAMRAVRRCRPATTSVDIGYVRVWARPACLVLTCALEATPKVPVPSPGRSSADRATPKLNRCAGPFFVLSTFGGRVEGRRRAKPVTVAVVQGRGANLISFAVIGRHKSIGAAPTIGLTHSTVFQLTVHTTSSGS